MQENFYDLALSQDKLDVTILRDVLLPELLGRDNNILYWAGKRLARLFPLAKDEDLPVFFAQAGFGTLKRTKAKRNNQYFELSGPEVILRQQLNSNADFLLEAGFLAETIQNQLGFITEAIVDKKTANTVNFLIQVDTKDPLDLDETPEMSPLVLHDDTEETEN